MFLYAQDVFVKKMACKVYHRIGTQMAHFSILNTKTYSKAKVSTFNQVLRKDATISWKCDVGHFRKSKGIVSFLGNQLYHKNKNQALY